MQFLFNDIFYPVSSGFWTAVLYRLQYGESIYDIQKDDGFAEKLVNLLYIAIQENKPPISEIYREAMRDGSYILPFCVKLYNQLMKSDVIYDKYKRSETASSEGGDFDELSILTQFSKTTIPERVLDNASIPQTVGLMCEYYKEQTGYTEYREMNNTEIQAMYGKRKKAGNK